MRWMWRPVRKLPDLISGIPASVHLKDLESCHARGLVWIIGNSGSGAIDFFAKVLKLNGGEHEGKPFNLLRPLAVLYRGV
ncbi:terminase [Salmonella enterica subsp. enterica]|nr:terminase [Salmonella enterica subsp. enterica]